MEQKISPSTKTWIALLAGLSVLLIVRVVPTLGVPLYLYGYDYGFYRYALDNLNGVGLENLITGVGGGYTNILFYLFQFLHLPTDFALTSSHFLATVLLGAAVFYFLKKYGLKVVLLGTLLTAFSLVQIEVYTMFLWKTAVALPLFVLGLAYIRDQKYIGVGTIILLLFLTHRTSVILFILTLLLYILILEFKHRKWKLLLAESVIVAIGLVLGWSQIISLWNNTFTLVDQYFVRDGIFLYGQSKLRVVWPYLLLAGFGLYYYWKDKHTLLVPALTFLTLAWMLFKLPFYNRVLIYFDIALIILAAYGAASVWHRYGTKKIVLTALILFCIFAGYRAITSSYTKLPLITAAEIEEIKSFNPSGATPFVLATSANDGPWLLGFLKSTRLGAPGLFEDTHTESEWQPFWAGQNHKEFLATFPRPLYLYQRSFPIQTNDCMKKVSANFLLYSCN